MVAGLAQTTLKKENGAKFACPSESTELTQAIGLG